MKKWIALMLSLVLALLLTACGTEKVGGEPEADLKSGETQVDVQASGVSTDVWGVTLTAKNVTPTGLTLIISHSGDVPGGELNTGSPFWLEQRTQDGQWETVSALIPDEEIAWTMEAWLIPTNDSREHEVNWEYLYGELPAGQYRLGKAIMLFRGPGDYEEQSCYAEFTI